MQQGSKVSVMINFDARLADYLLHSVSGVEQPGSACPWQIVKQGCRISTATLFICKRQRASFANTICMLHHDFKLTDDAEVLTYQCQVRQSRSVFAVVKDQ